MRPFIKKIIRREIIMAKDLKEMRQQKGLSIRDLAAMAQVSPSFLSDVENGKRSITKTKAEKIKDALNV